MSRDPTDCNHNISDTVCRTSDHSHSRSIPDHRDVTCPSTRRSCAARVSAARALWRTNTPAHARTPLCSSRPRRDASSPPFSSSSSDRRLYACERCSIWTRSREQVYAVRFEKQNKTYVSRKSYFRTHHGSTPRQLCGRLNAPLAQLLNNGSVRTSSTLLAIELAIITLTAFK